MEPENPYQPPVSELPLEASDSEHLPDASNGQRFVNLVIDYIGFMAVAFMVGIALAFTEVDLDSAPLVDRFLGIGIMSGYYVGLEALTGRTLGKLLTGTKVVDVDGGKPSFGQIVGRTACRFVPFEVFSFFGSQPGGWHDRWSSTRVVRVR